MTRQWLADPELMCSSHILGEHAETHGFMEKMEKGHSLDGFIEGSMFFGAKYIEHRHNMLVPYIPGHGSPLVLTEKLTRDYPLIVPTMDNLKKSLGDLVGRCIDCARLHI